MAPQNSLPVAVWYTGWGGVGHARYKFGVSRSTPVNMAGTTKYQLFRIAIDTHFTKLDASDDPEIGGAACAGCLQGVYFILDHVEVHVPFAQNPPNGQYDFYAPEIVNSVTWQGGEGTPAVKTTWGRVRSQYR